MLVNCKNVFLALSFSLASLLAFAQEKPEGLFINSKAPDFKAKDQSGNEINTRDMRRKGNLVVVFYRGYWCPYCTKYIARLQDSLSYIQNAKAQVIVVTPESTEGIDSTVRKTRASFPIIYDKDMKIASGYKVAFKVEEKVRNRYKNSSPEIDLLTINGQTKDAYLPVPAVYVVNMDGAVTYRYFEEDYKKRLAVKDLLSALAGNK